MHSVTLERSAQRRFALWSFVVGFAFFLMSTLYTDPMPASVFGMMVYDVPAKTWAAGFMAAPAMVLYGLHINGRWFWSPMMRGLGYLLQMVLFCIIAISAWSSADGRHLAPWAALFFMPHQLAYLRISLADMKARFVNGRY